jgi:hypothetical protein
MANFYAQEDGNGYPIPGTMMSVLSGAVPAAKNIIAIPAEDVVSTKKHPIGLRYFVRKDKTGSIIPNSLIISVDKPSGLVYEFKKA